MIIELLKLIPLSETFVSGLLAIMAATIIFKRAATYALAKNKNEITSVRLKIP